MASYLRHQLTAGHRKGHGIHSPLAFNIAQQVLFNKQSYPEYEQMKKVFRQLSHSTERLSVAEIGGGSRKFSGAEREVKKMARHSSVSLKYGKLLFRLAAYMKPELCLELGTSVGLSALCLALGNPKGRVLTLEGNASLCSFSQKLFREQGLNNITVRQGLFDDLLPGILSDPTTAKLVYIDGNHRYEPTKRYFEQVISQMTKGLIIFDDIHWSEEMQQAWKEITSDKRSIFSMDLYRMGIICPDTSITPGHYRIRY